ncbi:MAG: response regulator [Helicobacteraceae bacterium]|nr:response regulator [Helicobacteraceae bacterium]
MNDMKETIEFSKTLNILYVEDNEDARVQALKLFDNFFTKITVAVDGKDGLNKFILNKELPKEKHFSMVITDVSMPKMNGLDMISAIRDIDKEIDIIVISAHSEKEYLAQAIKLNLVGYLYKPVKLNEFNTIFNKAIHSIKEKFNKNKEIDTISKKNVDFEYLLNLYGDNVIASMTDTKGKINFASNAYEVISGYTREELIGRPHNMVRHPDMPSAAFKEMWATIKAGNTWIGDVLNLKKDGGYYWVKATVSPQRDENGTVIGYASIREDITMKKEIELLHTQVTNMLDNIDDGFLTFNKDLIVNTSYSRRCLDILNHKDIGNLNISEVIFSNDESVKEIFDYAYSELLNTNDELSKDLFLSLLPTEHYNNNNNIFTIKYKILPNDECLVLLSDVTEQRALEKDIKHEQQMQKMIIANAIHKKDSIELKNNFLIFLDTLNKLFLNYNDVTLVDLKRDLHTFKGLFAQKEMLYVTDAIHKIETQIENENFKLDEESAFIKNELNEVFSKDLKIITEILGDDFFDDTDRINVEVAKIDSIQFQIETVAKRCTIPANKGILIDLVNNVLKLKEQPFIEMLNVYPTTVKNIAIRVEKELYPLEIQGDKKLLVPEIFKEFTDSLVHVFRNAIDHGIEDFEQREFLGKDLTAHIYCSFEELDNNVVLSISDNGQGIDAKKILEIAILKGLVTKEDASQISDEMIFKYIFQEGFTTSDSISDLSGRGVGLSSVQYELDKLNGSIEIQSRPEVGTKFIFTLPLTQTKSLMDKDEDILLDSVVDVSKLFLENDMSIKVLDTIDSENSNINKYYSLVSFNGNINVFCIVAIDEDLLEHIFNAFVTSEVSNEEREEMIVTLPDEIVNTVAGLTISNFSKEYDSLVMSEPLTLDKNLIENFELGNLSVSKIIQTAHGDFTCTIIKMKD